jgi:3-methyl-2-oxobutanoate hydroxymethyltransferase
MKKIQAIHKKKQRREKITVLTAYDFPTARILDEAGIDILLVGDSLGMVLRGDPNTRSVKMDHMVYHTQAVMRGVKNALVVADMPYRSYTTPLMAVKNAKRLTQEGGADAVKLEGGKSVEKQVAAILKAKIQVMGHIGMTPQSAATVKDFRLKGRTVKEAEAILKDAEILDQLGVFSIVLECVPTELAEHITVKAKAATIGIGAGPLTDGQVLVVHDMLGFRSNVKPRFVREYTHLETEIGEAAREYADDVRSLNFPSADESFL